MTNEAINELFQPLGYTVKIDALNNVTRSLNTLRYEKIVETIKVLPRKSSIVDFGSGEGKLSSLLAYG